MLEIKRANLHTNRKYTLVLLILWNSMICETSQRSVMYQKYCGRELHLIIKQVCNGQYNGPDSADTMPSLSLSPYSSAYHSQEFGNPRPRRGSIVQECCHSPCGERTIRTYCAGSEETTNVRTDRQISPDQQSLAFLTPLHAISRTPIPATTVATSGGNVDQGTNASRNRNSLRDSVASFSDETTTKIRKYKKRKLKNGRRKHCRCRKRKRIDQIKVAKSCIPCNRVCKNVNKTPVRCLKP